MDRILLIGGGAPAVPESFRQRLHALDPTLLVRWNQPPKGSRRPARFMIEQCVRHHGEAVTDHSHLCERIYVFQCQNPDGTMMPLDDAVLEEIKKRDVMQSGYGPNDLARFCKDHQDLVMDQRRKIEEEQADAVKHASRFNRRQLLQAITLMGRHSLEVNQ
jgi:hypothetical protein